MFGIGGGELIVIIFIALMLFGSEKIPDIARTLGKAMAQLKNATNDIKSEIQRSADANDIDIKSLTSDFTSEIDNVKQGFNKMISDAPGETPLDITSEINKVKENIDDLTGPIKRQL
ncbi:Sec-independent protein translocase subunit TatA/TatB [Flavobacterium humi]|uniref:Sec-independent protein translocase protein TatA n=1 Tax=Flavobacterium humi TaxID=2562683 RepID=A0A4Z0L682_9FLAO|nr:twin-arginine translocase TatA/TatE family subunit [Flavobacterium humi]TGD57746.1 Sec-independent protein translocase TatA [Flavobacterium humi]